MTVVTPHIGPVVKSLVPASRTSRSLLAEVQLQVSQEMELDAIPQAEGRQVRTSEGCVIVRAAIAVPLPPPHHSTPAWKEFSFKTGQ